MITLKQSNGQLIATRGGTALICPFSGGVPVMREQKFGNPTMEVERLPCGSHCPHFDFEEHHEGTLIDGSTGQLTLSCGTIENYMGAIIEKDSTPLNLVK
jgi:hypothetical protein